MTRAEGKALEHTGYCRNQSYKDYLKGYKQAEKDLALTIEDVRAIRIIIDHLDASINGPVWDSKEYYEEILRRFNEYKEAKCKS